MTKNFKIEEIIHVQYKNRKFMLNMILNSQKMTNVNINDKIKNNDYHDKNKNNTKYRNYKTHVSTN